MCCALGYLLLERAVLSSSSCRSRQVHSQSQEDDVMLDLILASVPSAPRVACIRSAKLGFIDTARFAKEWQLFYCANKRLLPRNNGRQLKLRRGFLS